MKELREQMAVRKQELLKMKKEKEKALRKAPEGTLRVCKHGKKIQYYHRNDPKDFNGKYIREKDLKLAAKLAQKDYDTKILRSAEEELQAIEKYLGNSPKLRVEQIYENLHPSRQVLVTPIRETDAEYVEKWSSLKYSGKDFVEGSPEFFTSRGERVRSKSELLIADLLIQEGIPYRYEYPIYLAGVGKIYPDFTVLNVKKRKELFWEHLGMMDDPTYADNAVRKIAAYVQNNIFQGEQLILTYETKQTPFNPKAVRELIAHYLK